MKRLLPVFLATCLLGCAHVVTPVSSSDLIAVTPEPSQPDPAAPITVTHDGWSLTFPAGWRIDDSAVVQGGPDDGISQVLEAVSPQKYGRGSIRFALLTQRLETIPPGEEGQVAYAQAVSQLVPAMFEDMTLSKQRMVVLDERPASLSLLRNEEGLGIIVAATAQFPTGYILVCGGDVELAKEDVGNICGDLLQGFQLKR